MKAVENGQGNCIWGNRKLQLKQSIIYNHLGGSMKQDLLNHNQASEDCLPTNKMAFQLAPIWRYNDNTKPITRCAADNS